MEKSTIINKYVNEDDKLFVAKILPAMQNNYATVLANTTSRFTTKK